MSYLQYAAVYATFYAGSRMTLFLLHRKRHDPREDLQVWVTLLVIPLCGELVMLCHALTAFTAAVCRELRTPPS